MTPVVVMAGGRGLRLHPLSAHTPKQMLKVGRKPLLEEIIESYAVQGLKDFTLCLSAHRIRPKGPRQCDLIQNHFGDGKKLGVAIRYVIEKEPLGTAGALRLIDPPAEAFIVTNADVIARLDVKALLKFHDHMGCMATMCLALHTYQVPYGVAAITDDKVTDIEEKPVKEFAVSAGINVLTPLALEFLPDDGPFDMPELLDAIPGKAAFQLAGHWVDCGSFVDLGRELIRGMMAQGT